MRLNLEGNKLGDANIIMLCEGLIANKTITMLNLSRNYLTNLCTEKLGVFLEQNSPLKELYLYWNRIQGKGGCNLIKGLMSNNTLKILDLAWNSLGHQNSGFAKMVSEYIAANGELVVFDLSNNQLGKEAAREIADGLNKNHTIHDFMFQGNYGYVDTFGFLVVPDYFQSDVVSQHLSLHTIGKSHYVYRYNKKSNNNLRKVPKSRVGEEIRTHERTSCRWLLAKRRLGTSNVPLDAWRVWRG